MSKIFEEFSTFVSIHAFFRSIVKRGMFAARVWKSVECWILFYRYKPHWSSAPENNIYKCTFVWRQLLLVYNGGIHHRRQGGHAGEQETLLSCKFREIFFYCFVHQRGRLCHVVKKRAINTLCK